MPFTFGHFKKTPCIMPKNYLQRGCLSCREKLQPDWRTPAAAANHTFWIHSKKWPTTGSTGCMLSFRANQQMDQREKRSHRIQRNGSIRVFLTKLKLARETVKKKLNSIEREWWNEEAMICHVGFMHVVLRALATRPCRPHTGRTSITLGPSQNNFAMPRGTQSNRVT